MNVTERRERFRGILAGDRCVHAAPVFDPISARIAEDLGFEVGRLSGSTASWTVLGAPDFMVLSLTEFADLTRRICQASCISLMVDADHGYGNALNVMRTVEELETAGVASLHIKDVLLPQRFGKGTGTLPRWTADEEYISLEEAVGKMKAALAARQDPSLVISARTGPVSRMGLAETIRRAKAYEQAGVDAVTLTAPGTREEIAAVHAEIRIPLLLGSRHRELELTEDGFLAANGVRIATHRHQPFQAALKALHDTLKALWDGKSPADLRPTLASPELLAQVTRQSQYNEWIKNFLN